MKTYMRSYLHGVNMGLDPTDYEWEYAKRSCFAWPMIRRWFRADGDIWTNLGDTAFRHVEL